MTPEERLEQIQARTDAASRPPWVRGYWAEDKPAEPGSEVCTIYGPDMVIYDEGGHDADDAEFMAHSRQDVPALLAFAKAVLALAGSADDDVRSDDILALAEQHLAAP